MTRIDLARFWVSAWASKLAKSLNQPLPRHLNDERRHFAIIDRALYRHGVARERVRREVGRRA